LCEAGADASVGEVASLDAEFWERHVDDGLVERDGALEVAQSFEDDGGDGGCGGVAREEFGDRAGEVGDLGESARGDGEAEEVLEDEDIDLARPGGDHAVEDVGAEGVDAFGACVGLGVGECASAGLAEGEGELCEGDGDALVEAFGELGDGVALFVVGFVGEPWSGLGEV